MMAVLLSRGPEITYRASGRSAKPSKMKSDGSEDRAPAAPRDDDDLAMDRGSVEDRDMDRRSEPGLPSEEPSLFQYPGLSRFLLQ